MKSYTQLKNLNMSNNKEKLDFFAQKIVFAVQL